MISYDSECVPDYIPVVSIIILQTDFCAYHTYINTFQKNYLSLPQLATNSEVSIFSQAISLI